MSNTASAESDLTSDKPELSIVMPCLNEIETLGICIQKAKSYLEESKIKGEIVIADNGSTDGSRELALEEGVRLIDVPIRGYGAALYHGSLAAEGDYIIMGDSDDSYDFSRLDLFVEKLREGYDLVMGNRFKGEIKPGAMPWKNKYIGNPILTGIGRILFSSKIGDFHCGLRGISKGAFERLQLQTTGMEYASEMVIKATLRDFKIAEVPTTLSPDGRSRPPHLRPWRDGWRHLRFMLLLNPNSLFIYPGLVALVIGLVTGGMLLRGPVTISGVSFDVTSLLYSMVLIALGAQSVLFGMLARIFAVSRHLLPPSKVDKMVTAEYMLEFGLVSGLALMALGLGGGVLGTSYWFEQGLGTLNPHKIFRLAIPSALFISLGAQFVLTSFFLGAFKLNVWHSTELTGSTSQEVFSIDEPS
jgi:glycosyltransferase involved in cell wall biosynthesis